MSKPRVIEKDEKNKKYKRVILTTDTMGVIALLFIFLRFFFKFSFLGTEMSIAVFAVCLSYYIEKKGLRRWLNFHNINRPGELWVLLWILVAIVMVVLKALYPQKYTLPEAELGIIVPFVILQYLRSRHDKKKYEKTQKEKRRNNPKQKRGQ